MGRNRYNWKARKVVNTVIDDSATKAIKVDLDIKGKYDTSNELVLPSRKRKTKIKDEKTKITKILSKKHRKKLEKVVEKKKKRANRASLLESLQTVQATPEELSQLTSISSMQTKGLKRHFQEELNPDKIKNKNEPYYVEPTQRKINTIKGAYRKKNLRASSPPVKKPRISDPNILGFSSSDSSDISSSEVGEAASDKIEESVIVNKTNEGNSDNQGETNDKKSENDKIQVVKIKKDNGEVISNEKKPKKIITNQKKSKTNEIEAKTNHKDLEEVIINEKNPEKNNKTKSKKSQNNQTKSVTNEKDRGEVIINEKKPEIIEIKEDKNESKNNVIRKPAVYVDVMRCKEIQATRLKLPILAEEQQIMEAINENPVVIIGGETGCGKTTQVPQFLYEAGYALKKQIGITEPRRVAAIAMSQRVAEEMNLSTKEVSYLIRFEGNTTDDTRIKFMTDGVLLREMQSDFLLTKYSVIVLDEAHERSVHTDLLIGYLSFIVRARHKKGDPLKLIIMSATLRLTDFTQNKKLFKVTPPVINVEGRKHPVYIHFSKRTNEDYLKEVCSKTVKIHTKMPDGGILIFVTGQQEVNSLVRKLRRAFPLKHKDKMLEKETKIGEENDGDDEDEDKEFDEASKKSKRKKKKVKIIPKIDLDDYSIPNDTETLSDVEEGDDGLTSDEDDIDDVTVFQNAQPLWTLPLYSMLPTHKQKKVFKPPPNGCRLCIVSTNVAETSLTIPNIKYVIDTGKTKVKLYDKVTGLTSHVVHWTSKASAEQRAGRAGRTGPGHCYRLYSSAVFNDIFQEYSTPDILQKPIDELYLQMKCLYVAKIATFPLPTSPDLEQLDAAKKRLEVLGALKDDKITPLGKAISKFPVLPRFGKMLALSHQHDMLPYTICLVAALSVQEVLLETPIGITSPEDQKLTQQKWAALRQHWAGQGNSLLLGDNGVLLKAVGAAEYAHGQGKLQEFCDKNGLRYKAVIEIRKLRLQLTSEINKNIPGADIAVDPKMQPPTDTQAKLLRQLLLCGMGDQIAKKVAFDEVKDRTDMVKFKYAYRANNMEEPVFLRQGSVLRKNLPEYVIYQEIYQTNKIYMRGVTAIEPEWLPVYVPTLCSLSEPLVEPLPYYNEGTGKVHCYLTGTFGSQAWSLSQMDTPYPDSLDNYKWFARFLLEGKVFKKLGKYSKNLLSTPSVMVKSWARLQPRTEILLKELLRRRVCTRSQLEDTWKEEPKYLLEEYLKWLPQSAENTIRLIWPPLDSSTK